MFALVYSNFEPDHECYEVFGVHHDASALEALAKQGNALIQECKRLDTMRYAQYQAWAAANPRPQVPYELQKKARKGTLTAAEASLMEKSESWDKQHIEALNNQQLAFAAMLAQEPVELQKQYEFSGSSGGYDVVECRDLTTNPSLFA